MTRLLATAFALLLCSACDDARWNFERMINQHKYQPYEANHFFANGMAMRHPPPGTVMRGQLLSTSARASGLAQGHYLTRIPIPIDRAALRRGQERFDVFCATCHGVLGNGESKVAENMLLRKPPSLHEPRIVRRPAGAIYRVVRDGYGLMPSYASALDVDDRWKVVAYVQALQLSQNAELARLPVDVRREAAPWLN